MPKKGVEEKGNGEGVALFRRLERLAGLVWRNIVLVL